MTKAATHPIVRVCRERRITYGKFAEMVKKKCRLGNLSAAYVSQIARGHRHPSRKLADGITRTFPEISFEELLRFPDWRPKESRRVS